MKIRIGDTANGVETSEKIVEFNSKLECLEWMIAFANLYCEEIEPQKEDKISEVNPKMLEKE